MRQPPRPELLHTTEQAAAALDIPAALIRKWRHRGRAMPAGTLPAAAPGGRLLLWSLDELRPLADEYKQRQSARTS